MIIIEFISNIIVIIINKKLYKINNKKPVVAFICTSLDQVAGGLERQLVRVASQMYQKGYDVKIISYDNDPSVSFYKIPNKISWIKCGNGLKPHFSASFLDRFKQIYNLRKVLLRHSITHLITL